ncbi:MAG: T9SS type B sorting domain-containing protein [Bacteroidales bacterium]|nr:T9SS type B sorting domain-containing protein [Bacteroidales bacterium]
MEFVFKRYYELSKAVMSVMAMILMSVTSIYAEKFSACGDTSIWSAYLKDVATDEILEMYYPEEFFTDSGGCIPGYNSNRDPYTVPEFVYSMKSCDIETFEIRFRYKYADPYVYDRTYRTVATIWFSTQEELQLDFDDILKSKTNKRQVSISAVDSGPKKSELRYTDYEQEMWFRYEDGVIYKSGGGVAYYNICTLDQLGLTWDYLGGMITYMSVRINGDLYEEDFTDCSNAMKYNECPPKEPDFIKVICEQIPDCKNDIYKFYTESNLGDIHWVSLDGLSHEGKDLTMMMDEFNGGCVAVWAQKDPCTPPVYDTICPPKPDVRIRETEFDETICWNDPLIIDGKRVTESGVYEEVYTGSNGCDSIVRYKVTVNTADTTISDTVYRCGIKSISNTTYIKDTIEIEGACPGLQMSPLGKASGRNHVTISSIKEEHDEVSIDVFNNIGNITYTTVWMGNEEEVNTSGTLEFDKAGMYKIIAYDEETGCKDSMSFYYRTPIKPDLYFNPNNSEDYTWDIAGIDKYTNYRIFIYDRFGRKLMSYENEFDGWNGVYNGKTMPSTDYWYSIEVDEADISMHGHFTLIRTP